MSSWSSGISREIAGVPFSFLFAIMTAVPAAAFFCASRASLVLSAVSAVVVSWLEVLESLLVLYQQYVGSGQPLLI